jgi:hypothetical protein
MSFKKITIIAAFLCITTSLFSQQSIFQELEGTTYLAQNKTTIQNSIEYIKAINSTNFNHHRLKSNRNTITFEGGFSIVLFSAEELIENGMQGISLLDFPTQIENYEAPLFKLGVNNHILEPKQTIIPKQNFKIK